MPYQLHLVFVKVVFVKASEVDAYCKAWPGITFVQLPAVAEARGVGEARHWMFRFATYFNLPYYLSVDDSNFQWFGVTLPLDPQPQFNGPSFQQRPLATHRSLTTLGGAPGTQCDISLFQVLRHIEAGLFGQGKQRGFDQ